MVTVSDPFAAAWHAVLDGLNQDAFAGAVGLVLHRGEVVLHRAAGWACREPEYVPMTTDTIFDLASLTKVVATLPCVLRLATEDRLLLDRPVRAVLPALGTAEWSARVTVRHLLSHTSGLPAWRPLYLEAHGPDEYLAAIARVAPEAAPGERVIYSDLNFLLLGELVRAYTGRDIATVAQELVFGPLGLTTTFCPPPAWQRRIAATERGNAYEQALAGPAAATFPRWRTEVIWGAVHDGNAFYGLDGIAGHAGLFGAATDLARYGQFWLQCGVWAGRELLPAALVAEAIRPQAPGRGLGWVLASSGASSAHGLSPNAFGHTGFTGTSLWIDPERALVIVLLTNRVHPVVRDGIESVRAAFTAAVARAIQEVEPR